MQYYEYIQSIQFTQPAWLYAYSFIALLIISLSTLSTNNLLQQLHFKPNYKHTYQQKIKEIVLSQKTGLKNKPKFVRKAIYLSIIGLLFLSLAGPYKIGEKLPTPPDNRDIMFIVDNQVSMVLKDYFIDSKRVERLTMVKSVLLNFTNKLSGNRISIVTFSENAYTLVPFTTDNNLIKKMIPRIEATLTGRTSNPQKALLYSLNYLHNMKKPDSRTAKPILVLITDILRPPRKIDPNIIANYIGDKGYKLFVIAIGAGSYKKEDVENSTLIYHPASFERLRKIAQAAKGDFYWAKNTDALNNIISDILQTKKSKISIKPEFVKTPLFQWPLMFAAILVLIQYLFGSISIRLNNA